MELIVSQLSKLGLTTNEAKAYIALLPLQGAKASQTALAARIPRSKIYETLQSLHKKGFVEIFPEKVTKFKAIPFESAIQLYLDRQKHRMESLIKTKEKVSGYLKSVAVASYRDEVGEFTIVKAKRIIYKKLESFLSAADKAVYLMINVSDIRRLLYIAREAAKRIELHVLVPVSRENRNLVKKWMKFAHVHHYETQTQVKIAICDDAEVLVFQTNKPIALHSKDRQFTGLLKGFFQSAWESSPAGKDKISEIETGKPVEEVRHIRGRKEIYHAIYELIDKTKNKILINTTHAGIIRLQKYFRKNLEEALKRGVRIRCLAPITKENMVIAKQLGIEIRHTDVVHSIMSCFDDSYHIFIRVGKDTANINSPDDYATITNQSPTVITMREVMEDMWFHGISLEERIHELETGKPTEKVEILRGNEVIYETTTAASRKARHEVCLVSTESSPERAVKYGTAGVDRAKSETGVKIRYVFPITEKNMHLIKKFMKFAEVRHIDFSPMRIRIIDDKMCFVRYYGSDETAHLSEQLCIYSETSAYIAAMKSYFEHIWGEAVPADERIRQLERGEPLMEVKYLRGRENLYALIPKFMGETKRDIIWMTSPNGIKRIHKNLKPFIEEAIKRGVRIRCLTHVTQENMPFIRQLGIEVRHIDNVYAIADCYDDSLLTILQVKEDTESVESPEDVAIITNQQGTVKMVRQFLEDIWGHGMDAETKVKKSEMARNLAA